MISPVSLMNEVVHTSPTIGSNVEEVTWNSIHFLMWDIGGQESLRTTWSSYYANTEVIASRKNILQINTCRGLVSILKVNDLSIKWCKIK